MIELGRRASAVGVLVSAAILGSASAASAASLDAGDLIADLANIGYPSPQDSQLNYKLTFVAGSAQTTITFAFKAQPGIEFSDVSLFDANIPGTNLIYNGNFAESGSSGIGSPNGWTVQEFTTGVHVLGKGWVPSSNSSKCEVYPTCWYDDIRGDGENAISQTVTLAPGDTYDLSFSTSIDGGGSSKSWSSTLDILAYVSNFKEPVTLTCQPEVCPLNSSGPGGLPTPEPSTWVMMLLGLAGLGLAGCHRSKSVATAAN